MLGRSLARWVDKARLAGFDDAGMESLLRSTLLSATDEAIA
jgi:hypothetical protein